VPLPSRRDIAGLLHLIWDRLYVPRARGRWARARRGLEVAAFFSAFGGFVYLFLRLFYFLQAYLERPLEEYSFYAYVAVFLITLISSATVLVPAPGLAFVLAAAAKWNPAVVAVMASLGSTLGEISAYYVGYGGRRLIRPERSQYFQRAEQWMKRYGSVTIFFFAFIPFLMFDLAGIAAGALRLPVWKFLLACWLGRVPRSFLECYLGWGIIWFLTPFLFK